MLRRYRNDRGGGGGMMVIMVVVANGLEDLGW